MQEVQDKNPYYLHSFVTPSAYGWTLRLLCYFAESVGYWCGLTYKIAKDSNLFFLRKTRPTAVPTFYPVVEDATQPLAVNSQSHVDLVHVGNCGLKIGNRIFKSALDFHLAFESKSITPVQVYPALMISCTGIYRFSPRLQKRFLKR